MSPVDQFPREEPAITNETYPVANEAYPVQFSVDYPERPLNRLTTFFRIFVAVPIVIVLSAVSGGTWQWSTPDRGEMVVAGSGGLLFFAPLLLILFRQKYPRWWFDWNLELLRSSTASPSTCC